MKRQRKSATEQAAESASAVIGSRSPLRSALAIFLTLSLFFAVPVHAKVLYQWVNDQGAVETSHAIPPNLVHRGYKILDGDTMRTLRVVPPQMTDAEYAAKIERERKLDACEKALERVNFLYRNLADIDKAETIALKQHDARMRSVQQNLTSEKRKLAGLEASAARMERQGTTINTDLLTSIAGTNSQIAVLEREIQRRHQDKEQMMLDFDRDRSLLQINECTAQAILLANGS